MTQEVMMLAVRLPAEIEARLERLAIGTGRTKSYYARQAIEHYIDEFEQLLVTAMGVRYR